MLFVSSGRYPNWSSTIGADRRLLWQYLYYGFGVSAGCRHEGEANGGQVLRKLYYAVFSTNTVPAE